MSRAVARRRLLQQASAAALLAAAPSFVTARAGSSPVRLFLGGDVMTGRGIDQIQRQPGDPRLYERSVQSALKYVELAEAASGAIPRRVSPDYVWGDALAELARLRPAARLVNLETAVTTANDHWPDKRVHYRMQPANVACLVAAQLDCCTLANNHVLDWSYVGLRETVATLGAAHIRTVGAGDTQAQARTPAVIDLHPGARLLIFGYGSPTSGVPRAWFAGPLVGGINGIDESDPSAAARVAADVRAVKRPGDLVVVAVHWGTNWGYEVSGEQRNLAHALIDQAGVDVVFGHSSHHPRPIEVHAGKLILYGCGDLLNDYEGVTGHEAYRPELGALYLPELDPSSGRLLRLYVRVTRVRRFRIELADRADTEWLQQTLARASQPYGTRLRRLDDGGLEVVPS